MFFDDLHAFKKGVIGFISACTEVMVTQPIWAIKLQKQDVKNPYKQLNLSLPYLYKGTTFNLIGFSGTLAIQTGVYDLLVKKLAHYPEEQAQGIASLVAGGASSVIACAGEMLMTQQHALKASPKQTVQAVLGHERGMSYPLTGLTATVIQESVSTGFLLALGPVFKKMLSDIIPQEDILSLASGSLSGLGAAFVTHPANTIRTIQQKSVIPLGFFDASKVILKEQGVKGFYQGLPERLKLVAASMAVIMLVKDNLERIFLEDETEKPAVRL